MTRPGPLPLNYNRHTQQPMVGLWRAVVERTSPLAVSVPALYGSGTVSDGPVEVAADAQPVGWQLGGAAAEGSSLNPVVNSLSVGDRVWVACVDGNQGDLVIVGRRG